MTKTILLVEDEWVDVMLLRRVFARLRLDANLVLAADGDEAIEYLSNATTSSPSANAPLPDLVLLDLNLPRRSGFEVLAWLRGQPSLRTLPVVVFSSSREDRDVERAYAAGANSYLVKTPDLHELQSMIGEMYQYWFQQNRVPGPK